MIKIQKLLTYWVAALFSLSIVGWDFDRVGSINYQRTGRFKFFLLNLAGLSALQLGRYWPWHACLFQFYAVCLALKITLPNYAVIDVICITGTMFFAPLFFRHVTTDLFERIILWTGAANLAVSLLNYSGIYFLPINIKNPLIDPYPVGLMGHHTLLGPFLAFVALTSWHKGIRSNNERAMLTSFAGFVVLAGFVVINQSAMSIFSLACGFLALVFIHCGVRAVLLWCGVYAVAAAAFYFFKGAPEFSGRLAFWHDAYLLWQKSPVFGFGPGSWSQYSIKLNKISNYGGVPVQLHNDYLQGLFEYGLAGMGLLTLTAWESLKRLWVNCGQVVAREKGVYIIGLVVFGANAFGNFPLHVAPHGIIFVLCLYQVLRFPLEKNSDLPHDTPLTGRGRSISKGAV